MCNIVHCTYAKLCLAQLRKKLEPRENSTTLRLKMRVGGQTRPVSKRQELPDEIPTPVILCFRNSFCFFKVDLRNALDFLGLQDQPQELSQNYPAPCPELVCWPAVLQQVFFWASNLRLCGVRLAAFVQQVVIFSDAYLGAGATNPCSALRTIFSFVAMQILAQGFGPLSAWIHDQPSSGAWNL